MLSPDLQRIRHIYDYCVEIEKTILRYGNSFEVFDTMQINSVPYPFPLCKSAN